MSAVEPERDVLLHYIDKVDRAYSDAASSASRLMLSQVILSVFLIVLALGIVSADEELSLSGIKLNVPLWVLLIGGALLSLGVYTMFWSAYARADVLSNEAMALYRRAGYEVDAPTDSDRNPWSSSGPLESAVISPDAASPFRILRAFDNVTSYAILAGLTLLPLAAQVAACVETVRGLDTGWTYLAFVIPVATGFSLVSSMSRML